MKLHLACAKEEGGGGVGGSRLFFLGLGQYTHHTSTSPIGLVPILYYYYLTTSNKASRKKKKDQHGFILDSTLDLELAK